MGIAVSELIEEFSKSDRFSPEYRKKMIHKIPAASVVDREKFIMDKCHGRSVVDFGCASGPLHGLIKASAKSTFGFDKDKPADRLVNLDSIEPYNLSIGQKVDVYVCGEIIEHLVNPGLFLTRIKEAMHKDGDENTFVIITAPNAFSIGGKQMLKNGIENVNIDHVAWYSWRTLRTLIEKCGFELKEMYWYKGEPITAEGLIFIVK